MKCSLQQNEKRGSALLIVLGLLGFLMISAVAFSITMRTEYKAAAAYRQSVIARDLIATAFAEAQYAVELSMEKSAREMATMSREDKRRRDYLCPFKSADNDTYGRLIASSNDGGDVANNNDLAYLLDERAMRHVPAYVAYDVFNILELGGGNSALDILNSRDENIYAINDYARWRPITVKRPKVDVSKLTNSNRVEDVDEIIIGRMAWAVINLSDSLDINGIGSASPVRGLGLTGSEFAYTGGNVGDDGLFKTNVNFSDLPVFCTNADLSQYSALSADSGSVFTANGDDKPNFSWVFAASEKGEDYRMDPDAKSILAPFSVYSFWPDPLRGAKFASQDKAYPANVLTEESIKSGTAEDYFDASLFANLGASGQSNSIRSNFLRLVGDYLDQDTLPTFDDVDDDYTNHCFPNVENVPMVNEVGYDASNTLTKKDIENAVDEDIARKIEDIGSLPGNTPPSEWDQYRTAGGAGLNEPIKFSIPKEALALKVALGAYYPTIEGQETTAYDLYSEGFVGISARAYVNNAENNQILKREDAVVAHPLTEATGIAIQADVNVFTKSDLETLEAKEDVEIVLNPENIPLRLPETVDTSAKDQNITLRCVVDFFFRAEIADGNDIVDRVPVSDARNSSAPSIEKEEDIKTMLDLAYTGQRKDKRTMGILDGQFFRVTKAFEITFSARWIQDGTGNNTKYICKVYGADGRGSPEVKVVDTLTFGNETFNVATSGEASPIAFSPDKGVWSAIDPRYNWISPMYGLRDEATAYVGSNLSILKNFSSPHWLFQANGDLTADATTPSDVQVAYEENHADIVPFAWGLKVEDIRYNTNDTGSLLMPSELAFIPVPKASNVWFSETMNTDYLQHSIASYYENVGKDSFFRTIPIVDLGDGVITNATQTAYNEIINTLTGFTGIPEEHRSIMNVYAGQDNYVLGQRLRRLAMKGLPASMKDAVAISAKRLDEAANAGRLHGDFANDVAALKASSAKEPTTANLKYNTFINDYLFPIPEDDGASVDWSTSTSLNGVTNAESLRAPRPQNALDPLGIFGEDVTGVDAGGSVDATYFADIIKMYNEQATTPDGSNRDNCKLGQNDITNLVAFSRECFGDRQQLFLYIMRVDTTASASINRLHEATPTSTTRAVALVWRDAYGELPPRVVYFTLL